MYDVLLKTKGLSDELQSPKLDYLKAADLIESLIEELEEYRLEQKATDYFEKSLEIATKNHLACCSNISLHQSKETNYRQISLLFVFSKLCKCCILRRILPELIHLIISTA